MTPSLILRECDRRGLTLRVEVDQVVICGRRDQITTGLVELVHRHKAALIWLLNAAAGVLVHTHPDFGPRPGPHSAECGPTEIRRGPNANPWDNQPTERERENHLSSGPHGPHSPGSDGLDLFSRAQQTCSGGLEDAE